MRLRNCILTSAFIITLFSCERIRKKGNAVIDKTEAKVSEAAQKVVSTNQELKDKVFPTYDSNKPDTDNNKKRFKEHLNIDLTNDVKNIYTYGDFLGADYKVLISFNCDITTINKIVTVKNMVLQNSNDEGLGFGEEFQWWDKNKIHKIKPYKEGKEAEYWKYLWFDKSSKTAYYEEFSL